jgi:integrase
MQDQPIEAQARPLKRARIAPNLWQRKSDGRFEDIRTNPATGRQQLRTLQARTVTEAKREQRALAVQVDRGEAVAPSRITFGEVAAEYLEMLESLVATGERSERTLEAARQRYRTHLEEVLGRVRIQSITARHLSDVLARMRSKRIKRGSEGDTTPLSSWTLKSTITLAGAILQHAVVRGYRADNPISRLSKSERPKAKNATEARVLTAEEIKALIASTSDTYRPAIAAACFTGLRSQELLGLRWQNVHLGKDGEPSYISLTHQLTRATREKPATLVPLKTDASRRDIEIAPALAKLLAAHKLASPYAKDEDFIFVTETGRPIYYRNLSGRGLDKAANKAGLNPAGKQKLSLHDLRHTAITHLIRAGADVGQVARFAGHARPSVTLDKYLHEFEARKGNDVAARLGAAFADVL